MFAIITLHVYKPKLRKHLNTIKLICNIHTIVKGENKACWYQHKKKKEVQEQATQAARLLKVMSSEHRLHVLYCLIKGEMSVAQLIARVAISQSSLSLHLGFLRIAGLVETRGEAQTVYYRITGDKAARVMKALL